MIPNLTLIIAAFVILRALEIARRNKDNSALVLVAIAVILVAVFACGSTYHLAGEVSSTPSSLP